jgi:hypothetical protein
MGRNLVNGDLAFLILQPLPDLCHRNPLVWRHPVIGCTGPKQSQVRFGGWSQVQETGNRWDPSSATLSRITFYTASKMTA